MPADGGRQARDFLIIGAMKAGTTSLYRFLTSHPDVGGPMRKELHYFSLGKARFGLAGYRFLLRKARGSIVGEASPSYTEYPRFGDVARRIRLLLPSVRLIYCVRDPLDRMRSHYMHEVLQARECPGAPWREEYLRPSLYGHQLAWYLRYFEPSALAVVDARYLRTNREAALRTIFVFLGVDDAWATNVDTGDLNVSAGRARLSPRLARLNRSSTVQALGRHAPPHLRATLRTVMSWVPSTTGEGSANPAGAVPPMPSTILQRLEQDRSLFLPQLQDCVVVSDRQPDTWWKPPPAVSTNPP